MISKRSEVPTLVEQLVKGDRRVLAKAISLVESPLDHHVELTQYLFEQLPKTARPSYRLGVSGSPGVGKSTFINGLGQYLIDSHGKSVAVLAIDPSSQVSGGSILGDKTRMAELALRKEVFIRPSPAGDVLGGLHYGIDLVIQLCELAGFDFIVLETVGVGQSEIAVTHFCDVLLLLVQPQTGDELQGIKKGIMDFADLIAVNKADLDQGAAKRLVTSLEQVLSLRGKSSEDVFQISSTTGEGIERFGADLLERFDSLVKTGTIAAIRKEKQRDAFEHALFVALKKFIQADKSNTISWGPTLQSIEQGELLPTLGAFKVLGALSKNLR